MPTRSQSQSNRVSRRVKLIVSLLASILPFSGSTASASFPQTQDADVTFRAETALMEVEVRVVDQRGLAVEGLSKSDFRLFEDGRRQQIATFEFVPSSKKDGPNTNDQQNARPPTSPSGSTPAGLTWVYLDQPLLDPSHKGSYRKAKRFVEQARPEVLFSLGATSAYESSAPRPSCEPAPAIGKNQTAERKRLATLNHRPPSRLTDS